MRFVHNRTIVFTLWVVISGIKRKAYNFGKTHNLLEILIELLIE